MNTLQIRHVFRDIKVNNNCKYYATEFFHRLYKELQNIYSDINFVIVNNLNTKYEPMGYGSVCSCMNLSIVNPINNKYILISLFDNWKYHFNTYLGWSPNDMVQFFYAGSFDLLDFYTYKTRVSNNKDFIFPVDIKNKYYPFFYIPCYDCLYDEITNLYNNRNFKEVNPKLFFRGYLWDFRKAITNQITTNIEDIAIIDKNKDLNLDYFDFIKEISSYKASLSLPGGTDICHRDIESFGVGTPVFRSLLTTKYPDPLLPNYHYICFYGMCDYTDEHAPRFVSNKDFQDNLLYWWNTLKNNDEYLSYVSQNARLWFIEHCTMDKNIDYIISKLNISNLLN